MEVLKKLNAAFYKVSKKLGAFVLLVLVAVITVSIVARYFFNNPFTWTEEL